MYESVLPKTQLDAEGTGMLPTDKSQDDDPHERDA
jgi:hypothetical protein